MVGSEIVLCLINLGDESQISAHKKSLVAHSFPPQLIWVSKAQTLSA